jgi:hypothetical protein
MNHVVRLRFLILILILYVCVLYNMYVADYHNLFILRNANVNQWRSPLSAKGHPKQETHNPPGPL